MNAKSGRVPVRPKTLSPRPFLLAGAALCLPGSPALAQDASAPEPAPARAAYDGSEIVVTARQRSESLISVPVAVSAMSAQDINRYGSADLTAIGGQAPNVNIAKTGSGSGGSISIRGIGTAGTNVGFDQAVSVNVDGVQLGRGRATTLGFYDLRQVEILKGPQALFFGKNSPAGVISLVSAGPTDRIEGYARVGYEFNGDELIGEGAIGGPLSDTLGVRIAVRGRNYKGNLRNVAEPIANPFPANGVVIVPGAADDRPGLRDLSGRLTVVWNPATWLTSTLKVSGSRYDDDGASGFYQTLGCLTGTRPRVYGVADPFGDCKVNLRTSKGDITPQEAANWLYGRDGVSYTRYRGTVSSLTNEFDLDTAKLTSVTGYYQYRNTFLDDFDGTVYAVISGSEQDKYSAFSQELRLLTQFDTPVNFLIGAFFQDTSLDYGKSVRFSNVAPDPATGKYQTIDVLGRTDGTTISVFGQAIWALTSQLELAGGARWTWEKKDSLLVNTFVHPAFAGGFQTVPFTDLYKDENISPEATLSWHPTQDTTLYAAYKTGYKSGGFGLSAVLTAVTTPDNVAYDAEKVKGFELGAKGEFFDRRLRLSSAFYRYTFSNLQVNSYNSVTNSFTIDNAAKARQYGFEVEARFQASEAFALRGAVAYNHSRYLSYFAQCYSGQVAATGCNVLPGPQQDLSGRPTTNAPDWSGNAGFTYDLELGGFKVGLTGDAYYTSAYYAQETQSPASKQDGYVRFDASVRVGDSDGHYELALIGRNLSDKRYIIVASDKPGGTGEYYGGIGRPREILLQATVRY